VYDVGADQVEIVDDDVCADDADKADGHAKLLTDGAGLISSSLLSHLSEAFPEVVPPGQGFPLVHISA